jgi:hypothetical protein
VIQRTFTVIPGQNVNQASVARCDDVPGLGADWQPVQSNLTFPAANAIRDGINGANMPTVWCVMQRQGQNGPERTVIRCDNTTGAGPDWTLVDSNLTWPAATQEAFGTPSGGGQPFVPGVAGPPLAGPASTTPQAMGPVVGSQSGPSAAGPEELIDDLPRSTPRVGDSPECQQAQRSYEFARAEYPRVVLAITGQLQSFERILKVIEAADGGIPLELNEEGKANPDYGQWRSAGFMAVELREQLANAQDQMLSEQINVDRLCGFQIGNKWFPPKWRPGTPPSDNPPPLLPPSKTPPPKIAVNTPPKPPTNVTPTNPHSCTKYTCTYMEVTPPTSNYTVWDVCVPSGDWSRASCTFQWWDMAKLANNNTPDVNHPDGHDARDACQLPTVFGVTDHASFVKYCNAKFRGHVTEPEQSAQHADVALATPPDVAVDSPTKPAPPPDVAVDSPVKPATPPPPDVAIDSPRLATPPSPQSMPSHQPSLPNSEPGPEPAPPPTANSGAPSQPQINVYIPPAPPPEPGPPMVHDPHTPPVATSPLPSHQPAPPPIIDTFTPPKPPPPPTVYGQACSDPVNGVITCTDTEKRKCTTTSGTCDPRTGQVNPAPPKPSEPKTALPVTPLPPKTVEPTQPKPLPPKSVEPTQPKPLPPKTVEPTQPKPLPPKTVEPTQPQPLPAKTVEPTQPKPLPPKTAQAQPAIPPAPPPPSLPQQVAKVEPPPEPPDCTKAGGQFHVDRSEPLTIQQTSVGGSACRNRLTAGGTTHFTGVSISSQPSHGDVKQTGDYAFEYRPHKGFKGSDSYAVEVCGTSNAGSGCSIITYETTVE